MDSADQNNPTSGAGGIPPLSANEPDDKLSSALDNLAAAGRAMGDGASMPNLTDNPTAQLTTPIAEEAPLVPAAPMPGSIGSAVSGPAAAPVEDASPLSMGSAPVNAGNDPAANSFTAPTMTPPVANPSPLASPASEPSNTNTFGSTSPSTLPPVANAETYEAPNPLQNLSMETSAPSFADNSAAQSLNMPNSSTSFSNPSMPPATPQASSTGNFAPYNPFAQNSDQLPASTPTSNAPAPQSSTFDAAFANTQGVNNKAVKKPQKFGSSTLWMILTALFAISTVVLAILYVMKLTEAPKVIRQPTPVEDSDSNGTVSGLSCTRTLEGDSARSIDEAALSGTQTAVLNFKDDELTAVSQTTELVFPSPEAADIAKEGIMTRRNEELAAAQLDKEPYSSVAYSTQNADFTSVYDANADELTASFVSPFFIDLTADGAVDLRMNSVISTYESAGFTCTED